MSKQSEFFRQHPEVHAGTYEKYPEFDYRKPAGDPTIWHDFGNPQNQVGHQQRAFNVWWAIEKGGPMDLGLDLGAPKGLTPYAIHVDVFGGGDGHPFYAGDYKTDIQYDASHIHERVPLSSIPFITSNHSLEHMPGAGDPGIVEMLCRWVGLLRPGGVLAMVVPDNDYFDVLQADKDHKHAWGHTNFRGRVLDAVLARTGAKLVEYDTFSNRFSFNVVVERA